MNLMGIVGIFPSFKVPKSILIVMKNLFLLLVLSVTPIFFNSAFAQCNNYFPLKKGASWDYDNFNDKGKLEGMSRQEVTSFQENTNGFSAGMQVTAFDKKGKEISQGDLVIKCESGNLEFDMRNFLPEEQLKSLQGYDIRVDADNLDYPNELSQGQSLPDGSITIQAKGAPMTIKIHLDIIDRKVVKKEKITSPAGAFDCWKITSRMVMKNQMGVNMTFEYTAAEWIAEGTGMVRNESYKKGKLNGYTLLKAIKK